MSNYITYKVFGPRAILIEWPKEINRKNLDEIIQFEQKLTQDRTSNEFAQLQDTVISYNSLCLYFSENVEHKVLIPRLKEIYSYLEESSRENCVIKQWNVPVCYDPIFSIDMSELELKLSMSAESIIKKHTQPNYLIYFVGFMPGFPYLGGLNPSLNCERKENPRLKVPAGSVGIGGAQTGIYPFESPGGWQIIGNCPIPVFDISKKAKDLFQSGDQLKFREISTEEHNFLKQDVKAELTYKILSHD